MSASLWRNSPFKPVIRPLRGVSQGIRDIFLFHIDTAPIQVQHRTAPQSAPLYSSSSCPLRQGIGDSSPNVGEQHPSPTEHPFEIPSIERRPPIWASDYVCRVVMNAKTNCKYPIEQYISYGKVSPSYWVSDVILILLLNHNLFLRL